MAVRVRLTRVGNRNNPVWRVVVADSRSPRDGRFIEIIGQYKPLSDPSEINFDTEKTLEWLRKGAKPSDSVVALLKRAGIWSTFVADKGPAPKRPKKRSTQQAEQTTPDATGEPEPEKTETPEETSGSSEG